MQQAPTIPVPTIMIPPQVRQVVTPVVPMPTPFVVPRPNVAIPQTTVNVPVAASRVQPVVPTPTVKVVTPVVTTPVVQPQTVPRPNVAQPQGGILKQFGGGTVTTITTPQQITAAPTITIVTETGYSILIKLLDIWNGTIEQAQQLAALEYLGGGQILDVKRRDVIMEIIGMLRYQPFEEVLDFLTYAPNPEFVLWDQESLDEGRIKVAREISIQHAEEVGVKGVGKCRYCPSTELVFALRQLRSGDEPATIFVRCVLCNKQWRQ